MEIFNIVLFWITISPTYYGLMYAVWFISGFYIIQNRKVIKKALMDDLLIYIVLWVVLWWRLWYILFYNFNSYISDPLSILKIWEWWMSFHGWVIWVIIAMIFFSKKKKVDFYKLADQITLVLPIWLWLWRIWNYLNWELLWYSWYEWIFAVYKNWIWYFPSPLIEALLEWLIIFIVLNLIYKYKNTKKWQIASLFLIMYWIFRIFVEAVFRQPDAHIWYIWNYFTLWEIYSLPMIIIGLYMYLKLRK